MRRISIVAAISIAVTIGIVIAGQQEDKSECGEWAYTSCWSSYNCQSYEVIEAESLDKLKECVRQGLDKAGWQPQGGIVYNNKTKNYLQVMVHSHKLTSYP